MPGPDPRLLAHRQAWEQKPVLRAVYDDYHRRIASRCRPGRTLEIGGGSGRLLESAADVVGLDILEAPWLDLVADAQRLPFAASAFDNVVMCDVLHHLTAPATFFEEAGRVLKPGGRIVMLEPAITPGSWPFLHFLHPEDVRLRVDPLAGPLALQSDDPFDSNQALPTLLFGSRRARERFHTRFPDLRVRETQLLSLFAYPLSGGFRPWSAIPAGAVPTILRLETFLLPLLGPLLAFRMLTVVERPLDDSAMIEGSN